MYKFSKRSIEQLNTLHPDLKLVMEYAIKYSTIDFILVEGHRSKEKQFELFKKGRKFSNGSWEIVNSKKVVTNIDGINLYSKHNFNPSKAVDIAVYIKGRYDLLYDEMHLSNIAGTIIGLSRYLKSKELIKNEIIWGANWNNDGMILYDHLFIDLPHFEIS